MDVLFRLIRSVSFLDKEETAVSSCTSYLYIRDLETFSCQNSFLTPKFHNNVKQGKPKKAKVVDTGTQWIIGCNDAFFSRESSVNFIYELFTKNRWENPTQTKPLFTYVQPAQSALTLRQHIFQGFAFADETNGFKTRLF